MARISLARQQISDTGLTAAYSPAVAEGHAVENKSGKLVLHIKNESESDITVTVKTGYIVNGLKLSDRVVPIPAGKETFIGPLDPSIYNQTDGMAGQVAIDYSETESIRIAALLIP